MLWLKNKEKWNSLSLVDKVEYLRIYYCTGPCGQSLSTQQTREATNQVLKEVKKELKDLQLYRNAYDCL